MLQFLTVWCGSVLAAVAEELRSANCPECEQEEEQGQAQPNHSGAGEAGLGELQEAQGGIHKVRSDAQEKFEGQALIST